MNKYQKEDWEKIQEFDPNLTYFMYLLTGCCYTKNEKKEIDEKSN